MSKSQKFLQPLCFGFLFLFCGMNVSLAGDCPVTPGITCDATLAAKPYEERSFVFIDSSGVGYACICNSGGLVGADSWDSWWPDDCNAGAIGSAIAESTDKKLGKLDVGDVFYFSIGGRATKISSVTPDAYFSEDVCLGCERGYYYDADSQECKKSPYALPCDSNQNAGDTCNFSKGATRAVCQDVGMVSYDENILTCTAKECQSGYLLKLRARGKSDGICIEKSVAQKSCQCNGCDGECVLNLYENPNNNAKDAAYIPGDCECKQEGGCELKFKDGTVLKNFNEVYFYYDQTVYVYDTNGIEVQELPNTPLSDLVLINGESVSMEAIDSETTWYTVFKCGQWGENGYFAFSCNKGYDGGNVIGRDDNNGLNDGTDILYDKCIKKTASPQPAQPTVVDDTKKEIENAQKVLDDFYAWAKNDEHRSVWKDSEGKFNTTRLASDLTAGVVLGTVGGVVSGVVIKKKQVEKGFDALHCVIGGQPVADWGDEFRVGFYQR